MSRPCRRNACASPASASLTFSYGTAQAWLGDLARDHEPQQWDLCRAHADVLTVPVGWELVDTRSGSVAGAPPGPSDDMAPSTSTRAPTASGPAAWRASSGGPPRGARSRRSGRPRTNRYAALSARLPALAAEIGACGPLLGTDEPAGPGASAPSAAPSELDPAARQPAPPHASPGGPESPAPEEDDGSRLE